MAGVVYLVWARRSAGAGPGRTVESFSLGVCEGRHKACPYRELTGLKERSVANPSRAGTCYDSDTRSARHVFGGGVAGAEPPHKGGPNRPDRTTAVVSGQRRRFLWRKLEWEPTMAWVPPEVYESSLPDWDAPCPITVLPYRRAKQ